MQSAIDPNPAFVELVLSAIADGAAGYSERALSTALQIIDACSTSHSKALTLVALVEEKLRLSSDGSVLLASIELIAMAVSNLGVDFARCLDQRFMKTFTKILKMTTLKKSLSRDVKSKINKFINGTYANPGVATDPHLHRLKRKVLYLLQLWHDSFVLQQEKLPALFEVYRHLRAKGVEFPSVDVSMKFMVKNAEESPAFDPSLRVPRPKPQGESLVTTPPTSFSSSANIRSHHLHSSFSQNPSNSLPPSPSSQKPLTVEEERSLRAFLLVCETSPPCNPSEVQAKIAKLNSARRRVNFLIESLSENDNTLALNLPRVSSLLELTDQIDACLSSLAPTSRDQASVSNSSSFRGHQKSVGKPSLRDSPRLDAFHSQRHTSNLLSLSPERDRQKTRTDRGEGGEEEGGGNKGTREREGEERGGLVTVGKQGSQRELQMISPKPLHLHHGNLKSTPSISSSSISPKTNPAHPSSSSSSSQFPCSLLPPPPDPPKSSSSSDTWTGKARGEGAGGCPFSSSFSSSPGINCELLDLGEGEVKPDKSSLQKSSLASSSSSFVSSHGKEEEEGIMKKKKNSKEPSQSSLHHSETRPSLDNLEDIFRSSYGSGISPNPNQNASLPSAFLFPSSSSTSSVSEPNPPTFDSLFSQNIPPLTKPSGPTSHPSSSSIFSSSSSSSSPTLSQSVSSSDPFNTSSSSSSSSSSSTGQGVTRKREEPCLPSAELSTSSTPGSSSLHKLKELPSQEERRHRGSFSSLTPQNPSLNDTREMHAPDLQEKDNSRRFHAFDELIKENPPPPPPRLGLFPINHLALLPPSSSSSSSSLDGSNAFSVMSPLSPPSSPSCVSGMNVESKGLQEENKRKEEDEKKKMIKRDEEDEEKKKKKEGLHNALQRQQDFSGVCASAETSSFFPFSSSSSPSLISDKPSDNSFTSSHSRSHTHLTVCISSQSSAALSTTSLPSSSLLSSSSSTYPSSSSSLPQPQMSSVSVTSSSHPSVSSSSSPYSFLPPPPPPSSSSPFPPLPSSSSSPFSPSSSLFSSPQACPSLPPHSSPENVFDKKPFEVTGEPPSSSSSAARGFDSTWWPSNSSSSPSLSPSGDAFKKARQENKDEGENKNNCSFAPSSSFIPTPLSQEKTGGGWMSSSSHTNANLQGESLFPRFPSSSSSLDSKEEKKEVAAFDLSFELQQQSQEKKETAAHANEEKPDLHVTSHTNRDRQKEEKEEEKAALGWVKEDGARLNEVKDARHTPAHPSSSLSSQSPSSSSSLSPWVSEESRGDHKNVSMAGAFPDVSAEQEEDRMRGALKREGACKENSLHGLYHEREKETPPVAASLQTSSLPLQKGGLLFPDDVDLKETPQRIFEEGKKEQREEEELARVKNRTSIACPIDGGGGMKKEEIEGAGNAEEDKIKKEREKKEKKIEEEEEEEEKNEVREGVQNEEEESDQRHERSEREILEELQQQFEELTQNFTVYDL
ncbi:transmembrane [Cystoisospora suis]|uniref:Transmembrane n=1 Tax=Cystoisospora suis TaxID=483139 RepID=A0A2C6KTZ4_9APIC|nr:transmembrane [Cystoisospora suis]